MANALTHAVSLSEDRQTIRMQIIRNEQPVWVDLGPADVDLLIDALTEMREHMVDGAAGRAGSGSAE
jgi:hypothetical protein